MNRPRLRVVPFVTAFVLAAVAVVFGPTALTVCPFRTPAARVAATTGVVGLLVARRLFRHPDAAPARRRRAADIARRWRELDTLQNALDARPGAPAHVRAHLLHAYDYLILGREPGAADWHARQVARWLRRH